MMTTTIIIAALVALAATFGALYYTSRGQMLKCEGNVETLEKELSDLKCEMVRKDAENGDMLTPLSNETVMDFLKSEYTNTVEMADEYNMVFNLSGETFYLETKRLPLQLILRKGYDLEGAEIDWAIAEKAAVEVMKGLVMVKMHVVPNKSYDFMIVSTDRTIGCLRQNFPSYLSIIADADKMFIDKYWDITAEEYSGRSGDNTGSAGTALEEDSVKQALDKLYVPNRIKS